MMIYKKKYDAVCDQVKNTIKQDLFSGIVTTGNLESVYYIMLYFIFMNDIENLQTLNGVIGNKLYIIESKYRVLYYILSCWFGIGTQNEISCRGVFDDDEFLEKIKKIDEGTIKFIIGNIFTEYKHGKFNIYTGKYKKYNIEEYINDDAECICNCIKYSMILLLLIGLIIAIMIPLL